MAENKSAKSTKSTKTEKPITTVHDHVDIDVLMNPGTEKHQSLQGFDDDYVDIVDYIIRCTHKIWEEWGMGLIYTHYRHNAIVHMSDGYLYSREAMITSSINFLSAFPDRRAYGEDVVWTGNDKDGFHTSHRILGMGTHLGYSIYGPPSNKKVRYATIANCFVKENRVCEEWLVRDYMAMVLQMGLDPHEFARKLADQGTPYGAQPESLGEVVRTVGQNAPSPINLSSNGSGFNIENFVRETLEQIWNWRYFHLIRKYYVPEYEMYTVPDRFVRGISDYCAWVMSMIVAFPDAAMTLEHIYWNQDEDGTYRVAVRWRLNGTHGGYSKYGNPSGKRVSILGISHYWIKDGQYLREWTLFDEIAILTQIYR
jgi:predicted ester cyclase